MRLLVADPERRMSMEEIKAHTWFSHALPSGALHMNDWYMSHPSGIDEARTHASTPIATLHARAILSRFSCHALPAEAYAEVFNSGPAPSVPCATAFVNSMLILCAGSSLKQTA